MTDSISNIKNADLLFVTGSNTTEAQPFHARAIEPFRPHREEEQQELGEEFADPR